MASGFFDPITRIDAKQKVNCPDLKGQGAESLH
jgi:hypothetical protein